MIKKLKIWFGKLLWNLMSEVGSTSFPAALDSYTTKSSGDTISEAHMNDVQDAMVAIQTKIGTGSSTPIINTILTGTGVGTSAWQASGNVKIGSVSGDRDMTAVSGDVSETGIGFQPRYVIFFCGVNTTSKVSWGFDDASNRICIADYHGQTVNTYFVSTGHSIKIMQDASNMQQGLLKTLDADGFTITWFKEGSPSAGTAII